MKNPRAFDVLGNIAIVNFPDDFKLKNKKKFAEKLLKEQSSIKTILEKQGKVKGRLRKISTKHLAGEKTKEVLYKENKCVFRFNIDTTYFSPRLSNERNEIASKIKKGDEVLVMFAGVAPFSIVIAKNSNAKKVYSNEINREANKYAKLNIERNKLKDKVELIPGDIKKVAKSLPKFNVVVMPRPKLKESFLEQAFMLSKKNTRIYYYDFCKIGEAPPGVPQNLWGKKLIVEKIKKEAQKFKKKIKILKVKQAGEIAPYKIRLRVDFKVLDIF
ncbi:hypothetical protein KAT80_03250 [Candidatus Pacearchaeota archaeon]|nr:hypothetical protein [Candidatus Pacearchaeota archaeon]